MDKIIYGLDLSNDIAKRNMEILTKELAITDKEIDDIPKIEKQQIQSKK